MVRMTFFVTTQNFMRKKRKRDFVFAQVKLVGDALKLVDNEKEKYEGRKLLISKNTIINNILSEEYLRRNPLKQDKI